MLRRAPRFWKALGALVAVLVVLAAPIGISYVRYMIPLKTLPEERLEHVVSRSTNAFDEAGVASELLRTYLEDASLPGVTAAVSVGGTTWAGAAGFADVESARPVTLTTSFRVGSTGKPLTTTILARLVEKSTVDLDVPISVYKPDLPEHLHDITLRELASHTAGIRHYRVKDFNLYSFRKRTTAEHGLALFKNDPLLFASGAGFSYSTYGYTLLGEVMAAAAGTDFPTLLDQELIQPAGLSSMSLDYPDREVSGRTSFYVSADGKYSLVPRQNVSYKWAGGGIVSTPSDLIRVGEALLADGLLAEDTRELFWNPVQLRDGSENPQNYALGWRRDVSTRLLGESRPTVLIHHGGRQVGGVSFYAIVPEHDAVVSVMSNTGDSAARRAVQDLAYDLVRLAITGETALGAAR